MAKQLAEEPYPTVVMEFLGQDSFRVTALKQEPMNMWIRCVSGHWQIRYAPSGRWSEVPDPFDEIVRWADAQTCGSLG